MLSRQWACAVQPAFGRRQRLASQIGNFAHGHLVQVARHDGFAVMCR
jgi:hypothetical protein